ncbi:acyltransferase domain-containing protein [Kutzneria kofuensis]|uniref:acyltransferase domain-containing protein n=1 Tax=Kutzneria kofuensis TaxID=103725 RepID=UPI0031F13D5E
MRGKLMQDQPAGAMIAVRADEATVTPLLPEGFTVAVVNGPQQLVLAGPADPTPAVDALRAAGLTVTVVPTSHAFHSEAMRGAVAPFVAGFDGVTLNEPAITLYSAATGRELTAPEATDPEFWARQLVEPVRFDEAVGSAVASGMHVLLEVGPNQVLTGVVRKHDAVRQGDSTVRALLPRGDRSVRDDERSFLDALAALWELGQQPDWAALRPDEPLRRVPVPGYPYQRSRYWIDPRPDRPPRTSRRPSPNRPHRTIRSRWPPARRRRRRRMRPSPGRNGRGRAGRSIRPRASARSPWCPRTRRRRCPWSWPCSDAATRSSGYGRAAASWPVTPSSTSARASRRIWRPSLPRWPRPAARPDCWCTAGRWASGSRSASTTRPPNWTWRSTRCRHWSTRPRARRRTPTAGCPACSS